MAEAKVRVLKDAESLSRAAAEFVAAFAAAAVLARGRFTLVLSGGGTPKRLYELLAGSPLVESFPWKNCLVFWGDERFVPPEHPESNYGMTRSAMLDRVPLPQENIFPIPTVGVPSAQAAARNYAATLAEVFAEGGPEIRSGKPEFPSFDLVLLGIGADGHTASLFPGDPALGEKSSWTAAVKAPPAYAVTDRITLTLPVINSASCVIFLAAGGSKREVVGPILRDREKAASRFPAARVDTKSGELYWFLDTSAAS